jgi:hypothetical protein
MKEDTRPYDGVKYWAYILIYVNDILCVHHNPGMSLAQIDKYFKIKPGYIMEPTFYLGDKLNKTVMPNSVVAWGMSSSKYVQAAVQNVQEYPKKNVDRKLKKKNLLPLRRATGLRLTRARCWAPKWQTTSSPRLGFCAGVWNWAGLTSSLKCQCSPTFVYFT